MTWDVVERTRPDTRGNFGSGLLHLVARHGARTLCAHPCHPDDGWDVLEGLHPEDIPALDRCGPCYTTMAARKRAEPDNRWRLAA
jgi:hypothetical protein